MAVTLPTYFLLKHNENIFFNRMRCYKLLVPCGRHQMTTSVFLLNQVTDRAFLLNVQTGAMQLTTTAHITVHSR
jgi:hypothetical protein